MKSLTYGTLPDFGDFSKVFWDTCGVSYDISVVDNGTDARMLDARQLWRSEQIVVDRIGNRLEAQFSLHGLYTLLEALVAVWNDENGDEACEWAGDFASSILSTLGFEWV